jgi:hypothetical protein
MAYLLKAGIAKPEKHLLLGKGCITRNNTRAIAKQRTHNEVTVESGVFYAVRAEAA